MREDGAPRRDAVIVVIFPDGGRNYLSKLYNDEWMRANGLLDGDRRVVRVEEVLRARHHGAELPDVVLARTTDRVGAAIDLLQLYGISQLPVSERPEGDAIEGIVGSVSEKGLLDRAYRDPSVVERTVGEVMDTPLPTIDVAASLDDAFAHAVGRRARGRRGRRRARRRASSPSSTCSSSSPTGTPARRLARSRPSTRRPISARGSSKTGCPVPFMAGAGRARPRRWPARGSARASRPGCRDELENCLRVPARRSSRVDPSIQSVAGAGDGPGDERARRVVGTIGFHGPPDEPAARASRSATAFDPAYRRRGFARESVRAMFDGRARPTASAASSPRSPRRTSASLAAHRRLRLRADRGPAARWIEGRSASRLALEAGL